MHLKKDALPTLNKPTTSASTIISTWRKTRRFTVKRQRNKVIYRRSITNNGFKFLYQCIKSVLNDQSVCLILVGYVMWIFDEVIQLRSWPISNLKTAKDNANEVLPLVPGSIVEKYLRGKERPSKLLVVASRHARLLQLQASPFIWKYETNINLCSCKRKCVTRACNCKGNNLFSNTYCSY